MELEREWNWRESGTTSESGTMRRAVLELERVEWRESGTAHVHHNIEQLRSLVKGQYWNWKECGTARESGMARERVEQ